MPSKPWTREKPIYCSRICKYFIIVKEVNALLFGVFLISTPQAIATIFSRTQTFHFLIFIKKPN